MFTGIIEEIGTMKRIARQGEAMVLTIAAQRVLEDTNLGDSISVNGVCLTVVAFDAVGFSVDVTPETYRQTTLKQLAPGSRVNLERAMSANGRFGGHIMQGHVDSRGTITARQNEQNAVVFTIEPFDPSTLRYVLPRGSIAVDGISLTVIRVTERAFAVSIIPHTLTQTILQEKGPGEPVNLECDLLGKYVERLLRFPQQSSASRTGTSGIDETFLSEHGFI